MCWTKRIIIFKDKDYHKMRPYRNIGVTVLLVNEYEVFLRYKQSRKEFLDMIL